MILLRFDFRDKKDNLEYSMGGCKWPPRDEMEKEWNWAKLTNIEIRSPKKDSLGIYSFVPQNKNMLELLSL